jgi:cell division protein FtsA
MRNNTYTALDIGSSKISCVIFEMVSGHSEIEILSKSIKSSAGIRSGIIDNITEATSAISAVVYEAEKEAGVSSKRVIANISHPFTTSRTIITDTQFEGRQVLSKNLQDIADKVLYSAGLSKHNILHFFPSRYDVDAIKNVAEPEYMFASNLRSYHSVLSVPENSVALLKKVLRDLHLIPIKFVFSSYASSLSLKLENSHNFILIDIGEGTSDIAIFGESRKMLWAGSVALGGANITRDIAECFSISFEEAEKLKILYGNLMSGSIKNQSLVEGVSLDMLNKVISARIEEVIEIILNRIPDEHQMQSIILAGGVAKTLGISEFIFKTFDMNAQVASHAGFSEAFGLKDDPSLSTSVGLINCYLKEASKKKTFSVKKIFEWMWENF